MNRAIRHNRIYIGIGGNLGNVAATFRAARQSIAQLPETALLQSSRCYRTPPLGPAGQPDYNNAVIMIDSAMAPADLLDALQAIEHAHGRVRGERWGARTLDLDIIAIAEKRMQTDRLTVPHPQMHLRQFVLRPLCDLDPEWMHPILAITAREMLEMLLQSGEDALAQGSAW